jgi:hypothetical protein
MARSTVFELWYYGVPARISVSPINQAPDESQACPYEIVIMGPMGSRTIRTPCEEDPYMKTLGFLCEMVQDGDAIWFQGNGMQVGIPVLEGGILAEGGVQLFMDVVRSVAHRENVPIIIA